MDTCINNILKLQIDYKSYFDYTLQNVPEFQIVQFPKHIILHDQ